MEYCFVLIKEIKLGMGVTEVYPYNLKVYDPWITKRKNKINLKIIIDDVFKYKPTDCLNTYSKFLFYYEDHDINLKDVNGDDIEAIEFKSVNQKLEVGNNGNIKDIISVCCEIKLKGIIEVELKEGTYENKQ